MPTANPQSEIEELIQALDRGDITAARGLAERLQRDLAPNTLLTTTQAADMLGIRSRNTLKALVRARGVPFVLHGNRMMIPLHEVLRLRNDAQVSGVRSSDRLHDASAMLGSDEGLAQEELDALETARPGRLPWGE